MTPTTVHSLLLLFILLAACKVAVFTDDHDHLYRLHKDLLHNYSSEIRPVHNRTTVTEVNTNFYPRMVREFDVVNGILMTSLIIYLEWIDEYMTWNPLEYGGTLYVSLPLEKVWYPNIVLTNPSEQYAFIDENIRNIFVVYTYDGKAQFVSGIFLKSVCDPHVVYYPFDKHMCSIIFTPMGYHMSEVVLKPNKNAIQYDYFSLNTLWDVNVTTVEDYILHDLQFLRMSITLQRRPFFLVINLILPILFLVLLNMFVFVLPADSGEKASYTITVFLTLAVYVTIMMENIPQVSTHIPVVSQWLAVHLANNALVCICTVYSIHYYHKDGDESIPRRLRILVKFVQFRNLIHKCNKVDIDQNTSNEEKRDDNIEIQTKEKEKCDPNKQLTWKDVSRALDRAGFLICLGFTLSEGAYILYQYSLHK